MENRQARTLKNSENFVLSQNGVRKYFLAKLFVHSSKETFLQHFVTLAQKVNNSILQTFQERQKTFYLLSLSSHVIAIKCFQMHFLLDFM